MRKLIKEENKLKRQEEKKAHDRQARHIKKIQYAKYIKEVHLPPILKQKDHPQ